MLSLNEQFSGTVWNNEEEVNVEGGKQDNWNLDQQQTNAPNHALVWFYLVDETGKNQNRGDEEQDDDNAGANNSKELKIKYKLDLKV